MGWHYLRGNKSCASPGAVIVVDTETLPYPLGEEDDGDAHRFRLGCATYWRMEKGEQVRRTEIDFTDSYIFWNWLSSKLHPRIPTWLFTHNLGFDLTVLGFWERMESGEYTIYPENEHDSEMDDSYNVSWKREGLFVDDDPPTIVICHRDTGESLKCVDTLNYWRVSLSAMGTAAGVPKSKMPEFEEDNGVWFPYCRQDTLVLEKCVLGLINWVRDLNLGKFRFSAPSQAMSAFRHRLMPQKIVLHDESRVKVLERQAYFGGRVQNFYVGPIAAGPDGTNITLRRLTRLENGLPLGPIFQLDVTSLYPSVMIESIYPYKLVDWKFLHEPTDEPLPNFGCNAIARVQLNTPHEGFPIRTSEGTIYPTGVYWSALAGSELQHAINENLVRAWDAFAVYEAGDIFSAYVDEFWSLRRKFTLSGQTLYAGLCKLMLNSLYGKFGQRNGKWLDRPNLIAPEPWSKWTISQPGMERVIERRSIAHLVQERVEIGEHPKAFPAIAAFVTAAGRMRMRKLRSIAGEENVYYQAVDALYVSTPGYLALDRAGEIGDKVLGKLNLESIAESAEFRGLNNYTLGSKNVIGSIKQKAVKQADGSYRQDHFESLASILKRPQDSTVHVYPVVKTLKNKYTRGRVSSCGWVEAPRLSGAETGPDLTKPPVLRLG